MEKYKIKAMIKLKCGNLEEKNKVLSRERGTKEMCILWDRRSIKHVQDYQSEWFNIIKGDMKRIDLKLWV